MSVVTKKTASLGELPEWDLGALFLGVSDPAVEESLAAVLADAQA